MMNLKSIFLLLTASVITSSCAASDIELAKAVHKGEGERVGRLLDSGTPVTTVIDGKPLIVLAFEGDNWKGVAKVLLAHGADINAKDRAGDSALLHAAMWADEEAIEYLLAHGADARARATDGKNALLMLGKDREHDKLLRIAKMLVANGADPCISDSKGVSPLQMANFHALGELAEFFTSQCAKR